MKQTAMKMHMMKNSTAHTVYVYAGVAYLYSRE